MFYNHTWDCACIECSVWCSPTAQEIFADIQTWVDSAYTNIFAGWTAVDWKAQRKENVFACSLRLPPDHYSSNGTGQRGTIACSPQLRLGNVVDDWRVVTCRNCLRFDPTD